MDWRPIVFNLLDEDWITVMGVDGKIKKVSLTELIEDAHEIADIVDNPIVRASLIRVALSVIIKQYSIITRKQWADLWNKEKFDKVLLDRTKFELFDECKPFYQSASANVGKYIDKDVYTLKPHLGGNNIVFFDDPQILSSMSYEEAAKWLIAHQQWTVCSSPSIYKLNDSVLTRGTVLIMEGRTIFETLMLNIRISGDLGSLVGEPVWDRVELTGPLDFLTWRSRTIKLIADNGVVRKMYYRSGDQVTENCDPMIIFEIKKGKRFRFTINPEKRLWRYCDTLFAKETKIVEQVNNLCEVEGLNDRFKNLEKKFSLTAMIIVNMSKVEQYVYQVFPIPEKVIKTDTEQEKRNEISHVLRIAEELNKILYSNLVTLYSSSKSTSKHRELKKPSKREKWEKEWEYLITYWDALEVSFMDYLREKIGRDEFIDCCYRQANAVVDKIMNDYLNNWDIVILKNVEICRGKIKAHKGKNQNK
jgi:CRISPR type I-E-associated protein CasA/Cse1